MSLEVQARARGQGLLLGYLSADARMILRLNDLRHRLPTLGLTMSLIVQSSVTAKLNSSTVKEKGLLD